MYSYNLWQWIAFFIIYCLVGWIWECLYVSFRNRKWVNRGFLHGPFLPIYGFGAIIMLFTTLPVRSNYFLIFLFGMISATALEYVTGWSMEQIFHVKYWDYTGNFLNLNGYICLICSLFWGVCALLLTVFLHTPAERFVLSMQSVPLIVTDLVFLIYFIWDVIASAQEAFDLKKIILANEEVQRMQKRLDVVLAFAEDDKEKFQDYLKEKGLQLTQNREEFIEDMQTRIQSAKDFMETGSRTMQKHAIRILRRNPGSVSLKHRPEFDEVKQALGFESLKKKIKNSHSSLQVSPPDQPRYRRR